MRHVDLSAFALWICSIAGLTLASALLLTAPTAAQETIKVGIVLPLSGPQAFFGEIERNAFELALQDINGAGGVEGVPRELLIRDDRSRPETGVEVVRELIAGGDIVMLGGGYSSSVTYAVAEVAQEAGLPFLINTGLANEITEQGWEFVFRLNPPASEYAASAVDFLGKIVRPKSVAIIHEDTQFGQSQSAEFQRACEGVGISTVVKESYSHADFKLWRISQILLRVRQFRPDVIYMVSYVSDASLLMNQARALKLQPRLYLGGGGGFALPAFYELTREAAEGVMSVTLWHQSLPFPGPQEFFDRYEATYGQDVDYHGAEAYAAALVIADVLRRAPSLEAEHIRQSLTETKMLTPFGPVEFVSYDGMTNQSRLSAYLAQWIDGKLVPVWPENVAEADYVPVVGWNQ
jgi:branched-chain amino acid transport system substrate-binding protein